MLDIGLVLFIIAVVLVIVLAAIKRIDWIVALVLGVMLILIYFVALR